jgi:hypothetical protein
VLKTIKNGICIINIFFIIMKKETFLMVEKKNGNDCQKIEDAISDVLDGVTLKNATDFTAYLNKKGMSFERHPDGVWVINYKDKCVCFIGVDGTDQKPGPWTIWSDGGDYNEPEDFSVDEHIKEFTWAQVNICANCGGNCSPGKRKTIFGKEYDNVCTSTLAFTNPNVEALECIKKLVEIKMYSISREN